jgi:hypothetical protein
VVKPNEILRAKKVINLQLMATCKSLLLKRPCRLNQMAEFQN